MKSILIHIDERRRDVMVCLALGELFERRGCRVTYSSRSNLGWYLYRGDFDAFLTSNIILIPYHLLPEFSRSTIVYMLPTEGAIFGEYPLQIKYCGGSDRSRWPTHIASTARCFLWGENSRHVLEATGLFRPEQLLVTGAFRADYFLAQNHKPWPDTKGLPIGLISDFTMTNPFNAAFNIFRESDGVRNTGGYLFAERRQAEDRYWLDFAYARIMLEFLDECKRRGQQVLLRIHPREDIGTYEYILQKYGDIVSLEHQYIPFEVWLRYVSIMVGFNSTAFFEVVEAQKPAATLMPLAGLRLEDHIGGFTNLRYPILDYVYNPVSIGDLFSYFSRVIEGKWSPQPEYDAAKGLLQDVADFPREESSLARIVDVVVNDIDKKDARQGQNKASRWPHLKALRFYVWLREFYLFRVRRVKETSSIYRMSLKDFRKQYHPYIDELVNVALEWYPTPAVKPAERSTEHPREASLENA